MGTIWCSQYGWFWNNPHSIWNDQEARESCGAFLKYRWGKYTKNFDYQFHRGFDDDMDWDSDASYY